MSWALAFLVFALVAAAFGFRELGGTATDMAKALFFVFLALFVFTLLF